MMFLSFALRPAARLTLLVAAALLAAGIACHPAVNPPSAPAITGPSGGIAGDTLTFKVVSMDPDTDSVAYIVNWGDSSPTAWSNYASSGDSLAVSHVYAESGDYKVKARSLSENPGFVARVAPVMCG